MCATHAVRQIHVSEHCFKRQLIANSILMDCVSVRVVGKYRVLAVATRVARDQSETVVIKHWASTYLRDVAVCMVPTGMPAHHQQPWLAGPTDVLTYCV